jgi:hypothetical protein
LALKCAAVGFEQAAPHVSVDQVRFGGLERAQVFRFRESAIFHNNLVRFG